MTEYWTKVTIRWGKPTSDSVTVFSDTENRGLTILNTMELIGPDFARYINSVEAEAVPRHRVDLGTDAVYLPSNFVITNKDN